MTSTFEQLLAFQRAMDLVVDVYRATDRFPKSELYGLTSQMRRAAVSVVSHVAEGQGRITFGEWRQLLSQARGSLYELQAQIMIAARLDYLAPQTATHLQRRAASAARPLAGLIAWVTKQESTTKRRRPSTTSTQRSQPDG